MSNVKSVARKQLSILRFSKRNMPHPKHLQFAYISELKGEKDGRQQLSSDTWTNWTNLSAMFQGLHLLQILKYAMYSCIITNEKTRMIDSLKQYKYVRLFRTCNLIKICGYIKISFNVSLSCSIKYNRYSFSKYRKRNLPNIAVQPPPLYLLSWLKWVSY